MVRDTTVPGTGFDGMSANSISTAESDQLIRNRRLVDRLGRYWRDSASRGGFPSVDDVDPWMVGNDWKDCLLIEVRAPVNSSRLLAVGEHLLTDQHRQLGLYTVADVPADALASTVLSRLPRALSTRDCIVDEGETPYEDGTILYRYTLLPLAADGRAIDHVLAAVDDKFVKPARQPPVC
jgi:hypothetical protein